MAQTPASTPSTLDVIIYLSSLASNQSLLEPITDRLRLITAHIPAGQAPDAKQETELQAIRHELDELLTKHEPLRSFTLESLDQSIKAHFVLAKPVRRLRWSLVAVWITGIVLAQLVFALPVSLPSEGRGQVSGFLLSLTLGAATAWYFLTALRNFKIELKPAYTLMCLSPLLIGLSQAQLLVIAVFNQGQSAFLRYGGFMVPFMLSMFCMYFGLRIYARVIGARSWASSLPVLFGGTGLVALVTVLLPHHVVNPGQEFYFDLTAAPLAGQAYIIVLTVFLIYAIIRTSTPVYAQALKWLNAGLICAFIGSVEYVITLFVLGQLFGLKEFIAAIPFLIATILILQAGYTFKKTSLY